MGSAAPPSPLFNDPIDSHEGSRAIPALPAAPCWEQGSKTTGIIQDLPGQSPHFPWVCTLHRSTTAHSILAVFSRF